MASVVQSDIVGAQEVGSVRNRDASLGKLSSLIARLIWAAQEDNPAELKVPPDAGGTEPGIGGGVGDGVFLVWSSGAWGEPMHPSGHFVSVSTTGRSVVVQDGQCRAVWPGGSMAQFQSGNEGWSGREGQPPGPSVTVELLTAAGGGGERAAPATRN